MKVKLPLHIRIIIGLILGIIYSLVSSYLGWNTFTINYINPFGEIFIRLLKFIAVPLVLLSIISGVASLPDPSKLGRMGIKTLVAYMTTTVLAVGLGLLLVNSLQPGGYISEDQRIRNRLKYELWVNQTEGVEILDGKDYTNDQQYQDQMDDAQAAMAQEAENETVEARMEDAEELQNSGPLSFLVDFVPQNIFAALSDGGKMLQVIFFGIFFGIVLLFLPSETTRPITTLVNSINEVFLKMVEMIMNAAPYFVFALMAGVVAQMADTPAQVIEIFKGLLSYSIVLLLGLFFLIFVLYPLIVTAITPGLSYAEFMKRISPAQFLAFSTSSSAATLPVTMECVRDNIGVSKNVTNFVLPIGATVNMDGTSLYQAVAVVFLAQMHLVDLSIGQQLTIVLTATLASIGSAAVPSAGLVMMIVVLESVGLNPAWIAIIFPVDRILDMVRTVVNVTGDATVSTIIAQSEGELDIHVGERREEPEASPVDV